jgi:hypothetical protein
MLPLSVVGSWIANNGAPITLALEPTIAGALAVGTIFYGMVNQVCAQANRTMRGHHIFIHESETSAIALLIMLAVVRRGESQRGGMVSSCSAAT